jgi:penicillin-binding protein 1A
MRAGPGGDTILEAFKPGTAPPDSYSIIGYSGGAGVTPEAERAVGAGTGGLY